MLDAFRFSLAISGHNDGLSSVIGKGMPTLARSRTEGKIIAKLTSEKEGDGTAAFGRSFDSWAKLRMELLRANVLSPAYLTHAEDKKTTSTGANRGSRGDRSRYDRIIPHWTLMTSSTQLRNSLKLRK